jgi:Family of unknown function (DUF5996)
VSVATQWPALPYDEGVDTLDTLHMVLQILGKVRVALSPPEPEWAHVTLVVTARGLATGAVPSNIGLFDVEADLLHHEVVLRTADGEVARVPLRARPVAEFWTEFTGALTKLGISAELSPDAQEVPDPIPFPDDTVHASYDPAVATRFWRALAVVHPVFAAYRADFRGKVSTVQFFWGSADLNVTRFSGVPCAPPPDAGLLDRGAYDCEQVSAGWWPGSTAYPRPAFYAYGYPRPEGVETADLGVAGASWNADLGEFILDYDVVRAAPSPEAALRTFLDAAYDAITTRAGWDPRLVTPR